MDIPTRARSILGGRQRGVRREASVGGPTVRPFGWEDVWTCDGAEYVNGNDEHDGYLAFRDAMRAVDADIRSAPWASATEASWSDWDDEVMAAAGGDIDFYIVHHYDSNGDVAANDVFGKPGKTWPRLTSDVRDGFADHGIGDVPIAVTEHNLVAFQDGDDEQLMTMAVNAFYLAETIGQMAANGVSIANQWNLANGALPDERDRLRPDRHPDSRTQPGVLRHGAVVALRRPARAGRRGPGPGSSLVSTAGGAPTDRPGCSCINPTASPIGATVAVEPGGRRGGHGRCGQGRVAAVNRRHVQRLGQPEHRPHRAGRGLDADR